MNLFLARDATVFRVGWDPSEMIELLALPGWQTPPTPLDAWVARLETLGGPVVVTRESRGAAWLEIRHLDLRGYVMLAGQDVEAINFELSGAEPSIAARAITATAEALGWEVHLDEDDDEDDNEDE
jgi:hypothetical protein